MNPGRLALATVLALAAPPQEFRFSRPIEARPGWSRLVLPDDVLDACRPGLPDLRIEDAAGREVPYAFERDGIAPRLLSVENLETVEKGETTGMLDRGPSPGLADAVTFEISETDFLKPIRLESSEDRAAWKEVARGSIFAVGETRMLTLPIPPNDRRYLRFRLDDRNGAAVRPSGVRVHAGGTASSPIRRPVTTSALAPASDSVSVYAATLPTSNLDVTALAFSTGTPAFSRRARVYERVVLRDEVFRRLIADGTLIRAPGGTEPIDLPTSGISGRHLEIEIDDGDSPALAGLSVTALTRPRSLRFFAPEGETLRLLYGSSTVRAPRYDLAKAPVGNLGGAVPEARLGPATAGAAPPPIAAPHRAPLAGVDAWTTRRPVALPPGAGLAYLDLDDAPPRLAELRLVDQENRQVPFIVEQGVHEHRRSLSPKVDEDGTRTEILLGPPAALASADAIELSAKGPDYFSREVVVRQEERDARGVVADRTLGTAHWERRPGDDPPPLRIAIERPRPAGGPVRAEIENGNNAPITLGESGIVTSSVRVDFVFEPNDRLVLLSDNPGAGPPGYDFAMLAGAVVASPAVPARLGPPADAPAPRPDRPAPWFWLAVAGTVLVLVVLLRRTLQKTSS